MYGGGVMVCLLIVLENNGLGGETRKCERARPNPKRLPSPHKRALRSV